MSKKTSPNPYHRAIGGKTYNLHRAVNFKKSANEFVDDLKSRHPTWSIRIVKMARRWGGGYGIYVRKRR